MHLSAVGAGAAIEAGPIGHVVTIAPDGSPQCSLAWLGLDGDEVVIGTMFEQAKLRNIRRDPRIAISFETGRTDSIRAERVRRAARAGADHRGWRARAAHAARPDVHRAGHGLPAIAEPARRLGDRTSAVERVSGSEHGCGTIPDRPGPRGTFGEVPIP